MIDLKNADPQSVKSLARLKEPGGEALLRLLRSELDTAKQKLVYAADMGSIHRLQGRAEALEDLLRATEESAKVTR